MLGSGDTGTVKCHFKQSCVNSITEVNQVKKDGCLVPVIEIEYLPPDLQSKKAFEDGFMYIHLEETNMDRDIEGNLCTVDYNIDKDECVIAESSKLDFGSYNGLELGNLSSDCEIQTSGKHPNLDETRSMCLPQYTSDQKAFFLENMSIQELRDAFIVIFGWGTFVEDKQWLKQCILFGLRNLTEKYDASGFVDSGLFPVEQEASMNLIPANDIPKVACPFKNISDRRTSTVGRNVAFAGGNAVQISEKLPKPTQRDVEAPEKNTNFCSEALQIHAPGSVDELFSIREGDQYRQKQFRAIPMLYQDITAWFGCQIPRGPRGLRGRRPRKNTSPWSLASYSEGSKVPFPVAASRVSTSQALESNSYVETSDDLLLDASDATAAASRKGKRERRQHHKQWSLSEVMQLIEGVSQYGVGRWTNIKRLLFSASAHRTSVDLKDKWRNLLRASGAHMRSKRVKPQKRMIVPIPQSVLHRVKELAIIHPYPRDRKSIFPASCATPPVVADRHKTSMKQNCTTTQKRSWFSC